MRTRLLLGPFVIFAALIVATDVASAPPRLVPLRSTTAHTLAASIGAPNSGRLIAGQKLEENEFVRVVPVYAGRDAQWGLPGLVHLLEQAAKSVRQRHPNAVLSVGDISLKGGGSLGQHRSHQSGRDVDVAFYMLDDAGQPFYYHRFVPFDAEGRTAMVPSTRFDDVRNWALIRALLQAESPRVQYIFVSAAIRQRLLKQAERDGSPLSLRLRAARVMIQPRAGAPHDDHFHVRLECPRNGADACNAHPRRFDERPRRNLRYDAPRSRSGRYRSGTAIAGTPRHRIAPSAIEDRDDPDAIEEP